MTRTIGAILGGGQAQRFGADKTLAMLAGRPLLAHVIARLGPQVDLLALNVNGDAAPYAAFALPIVPDVLAGRLGPLAGIHAVAARYPDDAIVAVGADLPLLPRDLVARLRAGWSGERVRYAEQEGRHALAVLLPPHRADETAEWLARGGRDVGTWLKSHGEPVAFAPSADADLMLNVNTPEDLARAAHRFRGA